jgi:hypothetical protein
MAIIKYTSAAGTVEFKYPILTIARVPIMSVTKLATILVRHSYTVRALLVPQDSETLDIAIERYKAILLIAKGELTIDANGFSAPMIYNHASDLERGPTPLSLNIVKIHGGRTATVEWTITTLQFPGEWVSPEADKWIDWVYTVRFEIDSQFTSRRVISGFLRLAPNHSGFDDRTADSYRDTVMKQFPLPTAPNGLWQRDGSTWATSEDLTVLGFTITDKQIYSYLPSGALDGDVAIETSVSADGSGFFNIGGWFKSSANASRGDMQSHCFDIMESFFTQVLMTIFNQTGGDLYMKEENSTYRHSLRSNRVDFSTRWSMWGLTTGMNTAIKLEYTATLAANWLAYLTQTFGTDSPIDEGPYGSAQVCGMGESIAPIINIDWKDKQVRAFKPGSTNPDGSGEGQPGQVGSTTPATKHLSFKQSIRIHVKHNVYVPSGNIYATAIPTRRPDAFLIVTGRAVRPDPDFIVPLPPIPLSTPGLPDGSNFTMWGQILESDVKTQAPTVDGDYISTWSYMMRLIDIPYGYVDGGMFAVGIWSDNPMLPTNPPNAQWETPWGRRAITSRFPSKNESGMR